MSRDALSTSASAATLTSLPDRPSERTPLVGSDSKRSRGVSWENDSQDDGDASDRGREVEVYVPGDSSFSQTVLNCLGDLIGQGILACPLAFAYSGWVFGPVMLIGFGGITLYTLKLLLRVIEKDRRLRSYTDVIGYCLGSKGQAIVSVLFALDCMIWLIALLIVFADSFHVLVPSISSTQWKLLSLILTIPLSYLPLRYISLASFLGVTGTWSLVGILVFSGATTPHGPGSLRDPAHTDILPAHGVIKLGTAIGLFISGFGGHSLVPTLIHDMKNPKRADHMCHLAYAICLVVYVLVAVVGYLMYGANVSDQVTKDLVKAPGFSPLLNQFAVLATAVNAVTKLPLGFRPLADMSFTMLGLHPTILIPRVAPTPRYTEPSTPTVEGSEDSPFMNSDGLNSGISLHAPLPIIDDHGQHNHRERLKLIARTLIQFALPVLPVIAAIVLPSFESLLSFLGSGFAVVISILLPIAAKASVYGWRKHEVAVFAFSAIAGTIGVICTFAPDKSM
ncbi:transmembrane amino acid transporter protein-domain-containing protein [Kockovaella imperatae]|uniref:Transmembrane amino acid transporter protein-domain-containing protein n=1 Tax=Kockovaella imperatae TaxID=4999 RepID=A0A1Y1UPM8_9TREE|nr:transmembrane amino acid transporter protein-domain-containing protein [Kockovaella imperatae]ORX39981.1 transmembrane amino acid transporter protein-domain-containing protein [Kockovaella imperatae]